MAVDALKLRVHFIHDWLTGLRGGEKVLLHLVRLFPNSTISTLIHVPGSTHPEIDSRVVQTSFLQQKRNIGKNYRNYLPMFPRAVQSLRMPADVDLFFSISHAVAKGISVPTEANGKQLPHLCYCNTPMRYIWGMEGHYLSSLSLKRLALAMVKPGLRRFDLKNDQVTHFIANSQTVADRIQNIYHRASTVVNPGIDEALYTLNTKPRAEYYLVVSALVPYKRIDLAVQAFLGSPRKLVVIGTGPEERGLRRRAQNSSNIEFLGYQPDSVVLEHYQSARALLFPGEEDFGLTPVEAQATGTPVIAYNKGGATETILENQTGLFFNRQTTDSLLGALEHFETGPAFNPQTCRQNALRFTWRRFSQKILSAVQAVMEPGAAAG